MYYLKTPLHEVAMVVTALSEGVDISAASRIFGFQHSTISRWLERMGRHSELLHERLFFRAVEAGHVQLDELVSKVKLDSQRVWSWTAITAQTKLIFAVHIGGRSIADACSLTHQVWERLVPDASPIFTSDGLNQYFCSKSFGPAYERKSVHTHISDTGINLSALGNTIGSQTPSCCMRRCAKSVAATD